MNWTPEPPESSEPPEPHEAAPGAPYGQQPFVGDGFPGYPGVPGYPGAPGFAVPGQYDPHLGAGFPGAGFQGAGLQGAGFNGMMQPYHPVPVPGASRKDPAIALILSFFLPGLGTMINGQGGRGIAIMLSYLLGAALSVILIGLPIMFGVWVWGMVDAYTGAQKHNARNGFH